MTSEAIKAAFGALRDADELATLEAAARSRSEADWIVGMNATRAATIRLRSSFDGAVSLGRVQTPTLAILARREQEIRAFTPEPYWVVDATFDPVDEPRPRVYEGRFHAGANPRIKTADEAAAIVSAAQGQTGGITKLEKTERKERAPLLYDLTRLQSDASSRYGFTLRRTLAAAQRLLRGAQGADVPAHELPLICNKSDMIGEMKPIAQLVASRACMPTLQATCRARTSAVRAGRQQRAGDQPPHAIIPTRAERHPVDKMNEDDRRVYDLVVRRFLAVFHPDAVIENTRVETTVASHVFRTRGKRILVPGWRSVYGETADVDERSDDDEGREQRLPCGLSRASVRAVTEITSEEKETKPPRRYTDGSLVIVMETAGKLVDDEELREAMEDSGDRDARDPGRDHRAAHPGRLRRAGRSRARRHREGPQRHPPARRAPADIPGLTGDWEQRLTKIETSTDSREAFMKDIVKFTEDTVGELDAKLNDMARSCRSRPWLIADVENRKGYSCWSREDPGCRYVIWKAKAGERLALTPSPRS